MIPASHQLSLRLMEKCPSCRATIPMQNIHILDETEMNMLAHLSCARCSNKYLTYIVHQPHGLIGNAVLTDLTYDETISTIGERHIDENDFIGLYQLVHKNDFIHQLTQTIKH